MADMEPYFLVSSGDREHKLLIGKKEVYTIGLSKEPSQMIAKLANEAYQLGYKHGVQSERPNPKDEVNVFEDN